jgi:hypothetical protein
MGKKAAAARRAARAAKGKTLFNEAHGVDCSDVSELGSCLLSLEAMTTITFSGDSDSSRPVTMDTTMTEADISGKGLGVSGCKEVARFLPSYR